jgi:nucleoside-diphosphate-sugar epimerase
MASATASPRRVVVTGGTGFVGAHVCRALADRGHAPVAVSNEGPDRVSRAILGEQAARVEHVLLDITRADDCTECLSAARADAIVHAAGRVGMEASLADPRGFYAANVMGTLNVCEAARRTGTRKLVALSSNAVYYPDPADRTDEQRRTASLASGNPAAHYGSTKRAAEAVVLDYAAYAGLDAIALRVASVYGFGMRSAIYVKPLVEHAVRGTPLRLPTGGRMARDYTAVADVARVVTAALDVDGATLAQRVFNVSGGALFTAADVAALVRALVPSARIEVGDALTDAEAANLPMRAALDCRAAAASFGFSPTSLRDGLAAYVEDYRRFVSEHEGG